MKIKTFDQLYIVFKKSYPRQQYIVALMTPVRGPF